MSLKVTTWRSRRSLKEMKLGGNICPNGRNKKQETEEKIPDQPEDVCYEAG